MVIRMSLYDQLKKSNHSSLSIKPKPRIRDEPRSQILEDYKKGIKRERQREITDFFKVTKII
jgi:hypothetical protein